MEYIGIVLYELFKKKLKLQNHDHNHPTCNLKKKLLLLFDIIY